MVRFSPVAPSSLRSAAVADPTVPFPSGMFPPAAAATAVRYALSRRSSPPVKLMGDQVDTSR